jgi:hypothetical protein
MAPSPSRALVLVQDKSVVVAEETQLHRVAGLPLDDGGLGSDLGDGVP